VSSRSNKSGQTGCPATVTEHFRVPGAGPEVEQLETSAPRVRTRRPRDPRKPRKVTVRPPRKNPLIGRGEHYKNERNLVYDTDDDSFNDPEDYEEE